MGSLSRDVLIGAAVGMIGGAALLGMSQILYDLASPKDIDRENAIELRDPFIVLAQQLQAKTGQKMTPHQEKVFEQAVATGLSATMGAVYALAARTWNLKWLTGGLLFGALFWAVEDEGIAPAMGLAGDNSQYPVEAHIRGLVAHLTFGVVTAALMEALNAPEKPPRVHGW